MASPEERFVELTNIQGSLLEQDVEAVYNQLQPVNADLILGEWTGGDFDTGHVGHKELMKMRWAGKVFRSVDDADPIMVYDDQGNRVWNKEWGHSSLRQMVFRGVPSTSMIYDERPIFDHFRYVTDDLVAGAMDAPKVFGSDSTYYFYLQRLKKVD
ncbi:hypothetical protein NKR23_g3326 [Pleurostoma richardsiae]|uniref:GXWXG protein n=1 Tax=Pleurostoma richardsiae TaxID=41990 RepID=A0AA38RM08_9PEZI|nr:hypothetical protein NKR23_g3326 [Pleurostoma richardsiae]